MSQQIQKEWMNEKDRFNTVYLEGVDSFVEFAKANNKEQLTTCLCPCKECLNGKRVALRRLRTHLLLYGMNPKYRVWFLHGEESVQCPLDEQVEEKSTVNSDGGMVNLVDAYYGLDEGLLNDNFVNSGGHAGDFEGSHILESNLPKKYYDYKKKAEEKLYPSCEGPETTLSAIVVKAAYEMDESASSNDIQHLLIESDALSKVFGKDKGSRTRGFSSHISNKQVQRTALAKALLEQVKAENRESKKQNIDTASRLDKSEGLMMNVLQNQMNRGENSQPTNNFNQSPRTEFGSSSIPYPSQPDRFGQDNLGTRPTIIPKVNLLARDGAIVAKGFVETNATAGICHGKKVLPFERKVFVEEVFDGNAPIYDRPQDGNTVLEDVTEGGYLIWPNEMLHYI